GYRAAIVFSALAVCASLVCAQSTAQADGDFHRILTVNPSEPVILSVELERGDLQISYSRDGQVSITAFGAASGGVKLDAGYFASIVRLEQSENRIQLRDVLTAEQVQARNTIHYRIDVPYRTEVKSRVNRGS